jgi:hypothetical protein
MRWVGGRQALGGMHEPDLLATCSSLELFVCPHGCCQCNSAIGELLRNLGILATLGYVLLALNVALGRTVRTRRRKPELGKMLREA